MEVKVKKPLKFKRTAFTKEVKEPQPEDHRETGKIVKGDMLKNIWMMSKFWK